MAAKFASAAEAELACPVCFQFYVTPHEPKNLPKCSHILCHLCLKKMTEGGLKTVKCPQCNKVSTLPEEGVEGLTTILVVRNLAERHPEGIKQRKEYMQQEFLKQKEQTLEELNKVEEAKKQTQLSLEHEQREIEKSVEEMMTKAQELIGQIKSLSGLTQIQQQIARLKTKMKNIETSQSKLETMTDDEFHAQTDALANQIEKLKVDTENTNTDLCVGKFMANVQLGRIVNPRRLELVQEFGGFECASGIASKPNRSLAVYDCQSNPKQMTVFQNDNSQFKKQCQFPIVGAKENPALDIAISNEDKYLVAKWKAGFDVHSSDGKFQKTVSVVDPKPRQKVKVITCSITTTKDGRILTGSFIQAEGEKSSVVTVYDTECNLLKTIPLSTLLFRIADIHGTHVAVSGGSKDKVCVYDLQSGKETLNLDITMPFGICYDEQSDCLLIGRFTEKDEDGKPALLYGSCVIEQYCGITGKPVARLAEGLEAPFGLTITENSMLAVTDVNNVKLYKMH